MKITSEQEMLSFGESFSGNARDSRFEVVCDNGSKLASEPRNDGRERSGPKTDCSRAFVVELIGDVGVGKTTFVRGFAKSLGIKEPIISPSFTISKTYALPTGGHLIHYDFYRLDDPGLMLDDLQENLANPHNIVIVEWAKSAQNLLPQNRLKIHIKYNEDGSREVTYETLS